MARGERNGNVGIVVVAATFTFAVPVHAGLPFTTIGRAAGVAIVGARTSAWYLLRGVCQAEARVMLSRELCLAPFIVLAQRFFGRLWGDFVPERGAVRFAAVE